MAKYKFIDNFTDYAKNDFTFKKNDVIVGEPKNENRYYNSLAGNVVTPAHILFTNFKGTDPYLKGIMIPLKYVVKVDDSVAETTIIPISQQQNISNENQRSNNNETFLQKHKNHLIMIAVLVAGYFAYKKFKK